jgi:two-component system response regulator CpxR
VKDNDPKANTSLPQSDKSPAKMGTMNHILVIDDDRELVDLLKEYLVPEGFKIDAAFDHSTGLKKALQGEEEMVILDVMLPGGSGFELLKRMRAESSTTPVLLLTARGDAVDRIVGLEIGADDYLPKPFDPRELLARIRAILRRTRAARRQPGTEGDDDSTIRVGDLTLSPTTRAVTLGDKDVDLTTMEFNILEALLQRAGTIVPRDDLAKLAMGRELAPFDRSVDVHISKLRRKLSGREDSESRIKSIRGVGYMYAASTH